MSDKEKAAEEYVERYGYPFWQEGDTELDRRRYSCDGCDQSQSSIREAFLAGANWLAGELEKGPIGPKMCMRCNERPAKICGQCHICCPCKMLHGGVALHLKTLMGDE